MSRAQRSQTDAGIFSRSKLKTGTKTRIPIVSSETLQSSGHFLFTGSYARVREKLARAVNVLASDDGQSLPQVSVNDLERAVSTFLSEIRLGLPRGGSLSTPGSSTTPGRYGPKVRLEITDPEMAARVRANQRSVRKDIEDAYLRRTRSNA